LLIDTTDNGHSSSIDFGQSLRRLETSNKKGIADANVLERLAADSFAQSLDIQIYIR